MTIRTNPPGAHVFVDKQMIGTSPAATSFTYYGTREIEVVRDGYRTEKVLRTISPPWYQIPPFDFISETLWPRKIRDERIIDITMVPAQNMNSDELTARANDLRLKASQGIATPLPPPATTGQDFRNEGVFPGTSPQPIDPTFQAPPGAIVNGPFSPAAPGQILPGATDPSWQPGQILGNFLQPDGTPPTRIPEAGILPGGGYRPDLN
ncbi:MAG: PEGA domain-containing protein [Pirellulaceae bacterium]